jgi:hypothetical protein
VKKVRGGGCREEEGGKTNSQRYKKENIREVKKHFHSHVYLGIVRYVVWFVAWK